MRKSISSPPPKNINPNAECPVLHANIWSKIVFWWTREFLMLGLRKEYEAHDLYSVNPQLKTKVLGDKLATAWEAQLKTNCPNLKKALSSVFSTELLHYSGILIFQEGVCRNALGPFLVLVLNYFSGTASFTHGLFGGIGLLVFSYLCTLTKYMNSNNWDVVGMKIRVALTSLIYQKGLRLSQRALGTSSIGQITNLISNDVNRFDRGFRYIPYVVQGPIQVILGTGILVYFIGPSGLFGLLILAVLIPMQSFFAQVNGKYRGQSAAQTDYRVRLMNEIINGILLIKMSAWEEPFTQIVTDVRRKEMGLIQKKSILNNFNQAVQLLNQRILVFVIYVAFVELSGSPLSPSNAFLITTITNMMREAVTIGMPRAITLISEIRTSLMRIENFLLLEERDVMIEHEPFRFRKYYRTSTLPFVQLTNVTTKWSRNDESESLRNVSFRVGSSELLAVVGAVGSGKTTLIQSILHELPLESGTVEVNGKIAYVPQKAWLFNGSVRENILFGQPYKKDWFNIVVEASGLVRDFQLLPQREHTLIGDRGINLSGGQKARVNIARAVYSNTDIYLLDDPFSALDARVGREVFKNVIQGLLAEKCVLLVTHSYQYLEYATTIIVLENGGKIQSSGTYRELKESKHLRVGDDELGCNGEDFIIADEENEISREGVTVRQVSVSESGNETEHSGSTSFSCTKDISCSGDKEYGTFPVQTQEKELRTLGKISTSLYWKYFCAGNTQFFVLCQIFFMILLIGSYGACDYWVKIWTSAVEDQNATAKSGFKQNLYIVGMSVLLLIAILTSVPYFTLFTIQITRSSINLHNRLFSSILRAPMRFFEVNSYGRVFNRFVNDIGIVDDNLPTVYLQTTIMFSNIILSLLFVIISSTPFMILPAVGLLGLILSIRQLMLGPFSSLKRLESICRSPIFGIFNTTLSGLSVIRAFGSEEKFLRTFYEAQDSHSSCLYMYLGISSGVTAFLEWISNVFLTVIVLCFLIVIDADSSSVGLALSAALLLTRTMGPAITFSIDLDNQIIAVERILEYSNIEPEPFSSRRRKDKFGVQRPGKEWPNHGKIEFNNIYAKYGTDPPILSQISVSIRGKEKIGIVGRTGAGKSSLIATLFRIVEPCAGTIHVDGCDISQIGLCDLRPKISIIPQSPILFIGSVRKNLDPFGMYRDEELWAVLQDVQLADRFRNGENSGPLRGTQGLDSHIVEEGGNMSEGEKQLLCLARAILSQNKILILDEATANIDSKTEALIQKTISQKFKNCTILTIAHRLDTVMSSGRIMVLEAGRIIEMDEPWKLLQNPNGHLYNLCLKTGAEGFNRLVSLAQQAKKSSAW